ncbi:MAG: DNA (cytosine-5-)-methyltransferase [Planctomycetota bacterium]|nr:MAG: DNA (cytosine-5-)-methyltransferase [Planctomycetota bacterium]
MPQEAPPVDMDEASPQKTFCEFFAGIGLVYEALRRSGWQCVYANDIDPKKRAMYVGHYGAAAAEHYHQGDVWAADEVLQRIPRRPFLATASFPCTDMSLAGKRRGLAGRQSGALFGFLEVLARLDERRPPMVLLENVPGFLTSHHGADFAAAVAALADLGYWIDSFVVDAQTFVPQSRPRLFLAGYQQKLLRPPLFARRSDAELMNDRWRQTVERADRLRPARLRAAMESIEPLTGWAAVDCANPAASRPALAEAVDLDAAQAWWDPPQVERHLAMVFDRHRRKLDSLCGQQQGTAVLTAFRRVRQGKQRMEVRFDGVAGCLRTPRGGSAKQIVIVIDRGNLKMRWMTPREYARLQGAADYVLPDNAIQGLFGFGDAVCVPVLQWIDRNMLTPVWNAYRHDRELVASCSYSEPVALARTPSP